MLHDRSALEVLGGSLAEGLHLLGCLGPAGLLGVGGLGGSLLGLLLLHALLHLTAGQRAEFGEIRHWARLLDPYPGPCTLRLSSDI